MEEKDLRGLVHLTSCAPSSQQSLSSGDDRRRRCCRRRSVCSHPARPQQGCLLDLGALTTQSSRDPQRHVSQAPGFQRRKKWGEGVCGCTGGEKTMMQKKRASSFLMTIFFIFPSCVFQIAYDKHVAFLIRKKATNVTKCF